MEHSTGQYLLRPGFWALSWKTQQHLVGLGKYKQRVGGSKLAVLRGDLLGSPISFHLLPLPLPQSPSLPFPHSLSIY